MDLSALDRVPYFANCSRQKSFVVAELNFNSLENIGNCMHGCMIVLCGHINYFTVKLSQLPISPRKLQNFSTSNNLQ